MTHTASIWILFVVAIIHVRFVVVSNDLLHLLALLRQKRVVVIVGVVSLAVGVLVLPFQSILRKASVERRDKPVLRTDLKLFRFLVLVLVDIHLLIVICKVFFEIQLFQISFGAVLLLD